MSERPVPEESPLAAVFRPRSVAVVGASRSPSSVGRQIFDNLLGGGFQGPVYPVNPTAREVGSVRAYPRVSAIPDDVDLAVIAVPAAVTLEVVEDCAKKGVKGLVVITAGFREIGEEGARREARLAALLDEHGMRAIGPNCMGIMCTDPAVRLNATFSPAHVKHGKIAFVSQSGALGLAILEQANELNLGLSYFVSLGNKVNVSTNDLLVEWADDPEVQTILLYLENFGNPRRFVELARRIGREKPIIAVKSGRTAAGARAAGSHTGALAERDVAAEALFEQCGVVRARTIQQLFEYARLFSRAKPPRGRRVAIVTNSGGPGIMATDALFENDLTLAELSQATRDALRAKLLPEASVANPVDVIAGGGPEHFRVALTETLADPNVDAVIVIYTPPVFINEHEVARAIIEPARAHPEKTLIACVLGKTAGSSAFHLLTEADVPTFVYPEPAVRALSALVAYGERSRRDAGIVPRLDGIAHAAAADIVRRAIEAGHEWLEPRDAMDLMRAYGIPVARTRRVASAKEAADAAREMDAPVALKAIAPGLVHKSEAGGVALGIPSPDAASAAYETMMKRVAEHGFDLEGALVQEMLPPGREVILGMSCDPKFGPLLMFGLGGVYVEVLKDVVFRLAPLTDADARRMVRAIRGWPLLQGVRGEPAADVAAIEDALLRLSQLVSDFHEIAEIDINPMIVRDDGGGACAPDARVRLWPRGEAPRAAAVTRDIRPPANAEH